MSVDYYNFAYPKILLSPDSLWIQVRHYCHWELTILLTQTSRLLLGSLVVGM